MRNGLSKKQLQVCKCHQLDRDFVRLGTHLGSHFNYFLWEKGSRKNSCKYVTVINFRSLTPWIHGARHDANAISYSWSLEIFLILLRKNDDFKEIKRSRDSFTRVSISMISSIYKIWMTFAAKFNKISFVIWVLSFRYF